MRRDPVLTVTSLLSLLLLMIHLSQDVILQREGSVEYPIPVVVFALMLYATLMLHDRITGYVIMLLGGLFSAAMIVTHGHGFVVGKSGGLFFVWVLFALSTTGWVTMLLAIRGLVRSVRARRAA